jgi:capsule polysaccharide export protein KpsE/RkpR
MSLSSLLTLLPTLVLIAAIVFSQWRSGAKEVSGEVMANYEKLVAQLREELTRMKTEMGNMEKGLIAKIAKLEGQLQEKDSQLSSLQTILANRNPELETVLGEIRDFMKQLKDETNHQTTILEAGKSRDRQIDDSTDRQVGNVMRK